MLYSPPWGWELQAQPHFELFSPSAVSHVIPPMRPIATVRLCMAHALNFMDWRIRLYGRTANSSRIRRWPAGPPSAGSRPTGCGVNCVRLPAIFSLRGTSGYTQELRKRRLTPQRPDASTPDALCPIPAFAPGLQRGPLLAFYGASVVDEQGPPEPKAKKAVASSWNWFTNPSNSGDYLA